jgi:hypothetical protein
MTKEEQIQDCERNLNDTLGIVNHARSSMYQFATVKQVRQIKKLVKAFNKELEKLEVSLGER